MTGNALTGSKRFSNADLKKLIIPLFLEQMLVLLVGMADTFMVAFAGDAAVSGVSLVNMFVTLFLFVFAALAAGGAVVISQYIGHGDRDEGNHAAGQLLLIAVVFSLACTFLVLIFNRQLLVLLFGAVEEPVMDACLIYQRIMTYSFVPIGIYNVGAAMCRSMSKTGTTLLVSGISNVINVAGNFVGIFILKMGVAGAAWPTFYARAFSAVIITIFCIRRRNTVYYVAKYIFSVSASRIKKILKVAVPNSIENGIFQFTKVILSSFIAGFGTAQIASNGIAQTIWSLSAVMIIAMGPVFITVIGQCMGAGDTAGAEYYFKKLLKITIIAAVAWNMLFIALTPLIMSAYPVSAEIKELVIVLVIIHNIFNGFVWPVGGTLPYGLRASGDIRFTMIITISSTLLVRLVFSYVFAIVLQMGVIGIAWAMVCDWSARAVAAFIRYKQGKWKNKRII